MTLTGIFTDTQFRGFLRSLEQLENTKTLAELALSTRSGRQARIETGDFATLMSFSNSPPVRTGLPFPMSVTSNRVDVGTALDILPEVAEDGFTLRLTATASVMQFLGYDDPGPFSVTPGERGAVQLQTGTPLPSFRMRQCSRTANVWDGQTLVLWLGPTQSPGSPHDPQTRQFVVFVTPTLIDPAGNRIHTEEDLPFARDGVPHQ